MAGFLTGLMDTVGKGLQQKNAEYHQQQAAEKARQVDTQWTAMQSAVTTLDKLKQKQDRGEQLTPQEVQQAQQAAGVWQSSQAEYTKLTKANKPLAEAFQKVGGFVQKVLTSKKNQLNGPQQAAPPKQSLPSENGTLGTGSVPKVGDQPGQPSPNGKLSAPAPQAKPEGGQPSQPLSAPPQASIPALGPKQSSMLYGSPQFAKEQDARSKTEQEQKNEEFKTGQAKDLDVFKSNEQIRVKKQEDLDQQVAELQQEKQRDEAAAAFAKTLDPEKAKEFTQAYGNKKFLGVAELKQDTAKPDKKTNIHVKLKGGDWVAAEESAEGKITTLDGKPIDPATIEDVNKTGAAPPPKYSGELGERVSAQRVIDDPKIPESAPEKKAARATLKSLDTKAKAVEVRINNASQGNSPGNVTDEELKALAQHQIQTGESPAFGMGKSQERDRYNKVFAEELLSDPDSGAARAAYKAGSANLTQLTKIRGQIGSFEDAFQADLKNAEDAAKDVPRSSAKLFNRWQQLGAANLEDYPELAAFRVATQTAVNQYARLMFSATGGGTSTDSARAHAEDLLNTAMASGAYGAALKQMQKEVKNRTDGLDREIDQQKGKLANSKPSPNGTLTAPPAAGSEPKIKIISVK